MSNRCSVCTRPWAASADSEAARVCWRRFNCAGDVRDCERRGRILGRRREAALRLELAEARALAAHARNVLDTCGRLPDVHDDTATCPCAACEVVRAIPREWA